jgi:16S rRNA (cytosine967-C5)-methyltransferase
VSSKVSAARRAAFDVLWRVATEDAYASNLLAAERYDQLSREDHALLQELVLGVLRWQARLDYLIEYHARRPINKLDAAVVIALRLGLYQLHYLSRIPPHAAINEAVKLVKEQKKQSAAPFVNAVLRAAQRADQSDLLSSIKNLANQFSVETSHPTWLLERWMNRFGAEEARALALSNNHAPHAALRFNAARPNEDETRQWLAGHNIAIKPSALTPQAFVIESGTISAQATPLRAGWLYLQDEASQLIAHLSAGLSHASNLAPQILNLKLLDLCAAPGSKTTLLAALLPANTLHVATDLHLHRLRTMKELCVRLGVTHIHPLQLDAARTLPFTASLHQGGVFDLVLLDAPCSGLGTLQRHPEIKWRMTPEKIVELAELQKRLLAQAARQVRPGGLLTYAVCSTEPEEGEEVIAQFRQTHPEFRDVTCERLIELSLDPAPLLTSSFGARTFTHRQGTESFFVCVLWRRK